MTAVVEFQAFYDNDDNFIVKEFAIVSQNCKIHMIFRPPFKKSFLTPKAQRTARWLTRHFHRIPWETEEGVGYDTDLFRVLCGAFRVVYTNGQDKVRFLEQFHYNVRDMSTPDKYNTDDDHEVQCTLPQHQDIQVPCALHNALKGYKSTRDICPVCNHVFKRVGHSE